MLPKSVHHQTVLVCYFTALMYSGIGVIMAKSRGAEDELNTVVAGTTTGLLYKCSGVYLRAVRSCFTFFLKIT